MVGGGGAMMMCLFLVMVKTQEDMVFLQRVSTTGPDYKLVENLRRELMTNNNDYELQEARAASDRALKDALHDDGFRTPNDTLGNAGKHTPVVKFPNVQYRALKATSEKTRFRAQEATSDNVTFRASEATAENGRYRTSDATSNKITTHKPESTSRTATTYAQNVPINLTYSTPPVMEFVVKNALIKALRLAGSQITTPVPTLRRSYQIYRYNNMNKRKHDDFGVTFTVRRFKFRPI